MHLICTDFYHKLEEVIWVYDYDPFLPIVMTMILQLTAHNKAG